MKVRLVRRGGIAGVAVGTTVDTDDLPPQTVAALQQVTGPDTAKPAGRPSGADRFSYELTLGEGAAATTSVLQEHEVPDALSPLLDRLATDGEPGG